MPWSARTRAERACGAGAMARRLLHVQPERVHAADDEMGWCDGQAMPGKAVEVSGSGCADAAGSSGEQDDASLYDTAYVDGTNVGVYIRDLPRLTNKGSTVDEEMTAANWILKAIVSEI